MRDTLLSLARSHRGKFSDKWSSYLAAYDRMLAEYKHRNIRLLEIGVQNGGSLEIWARYFAAATHLIGCDINPACAALEYEDARIGLVIGDANTDAVQAQILARCPQFDVIIDDGSHTSPDIVKSFARYFSTLSTGGLFIIEDMHCSYWQEFDGGLYHPTSSMAFLKRLTDVMNHEHWGLATTRAEFLDDFARQYGIAFDDDLLTCIHSIEFINSVCVIRKSYPVESRLGARHIAGVDGLVLAGMAGLTGSLSTPPNQSTNIWSWPARQSPEAFAEDDAAPLIVPAPPVIELYLDSGQGFSAVGCIRQAVELHLDQAEFSFDLSGYSKLVALRLDPLNDSVVVEIEEMRLVTDVEEVNLIGMIAANDCLTNANVYYFDSVDPRIYFTDIDPAQLNGARRLQCRFRYLQVGRDAVQAALRELSVNQVRRDTTYRATIASLREKVQVYESLKPAFDHGLATFERTLEQVRRDHDMAMARGSAAYGLLKTEHVEALEQLRKSDNVARDVLIRERDRREQELITAHSLALERQRHEHADAVHAFAQAVSCQSADHALSIQALQRAQDIAAAKAEQYANIRLCEASDTIVRINAERLTDQSTLSVRINQLEQKLATVQDWWGYRLLAKINRPSSVV